MRTLVSLSLSHRLGFIYVSLMQARKTGEVRGELFEACYTEASEFSCGADANRTACCQ